MWVYQGWIWLGLNNPKGLSYISGFTSGVPAGRLVILDMEAESAPLWTWSRSLYNTSFVLAYMDNFGGNNGLYVCGHGATLLCSS
jgi:alpha-N-acetylglucosaminidase